MYLLRKERFASLDGALELSWLTTSSVVYLLIVLLLILILTLTKCSQTMTQVARISLLHLHAITNALRRATNSLSSTPVGAKETLEQLHLSQRHSLVGLKSRAQIVQSSITTLATFTLSRR